MSDYINEGAESFNEHPKKRGFTFGKLIKWICLALVILVYVILVARCVQTNDHEIVKQVLVNDTFIKAYENNPERFTVEKYGIEELWAAVREGRLIEFNHMYYVPLASQLQISVKFNMDLPLCEYDEEIPFRFRLRDENGNEYSDYWYISKEKMGYGYIRVCFEGVKLEKEPEGIYNKQLEQSEIVYYEDVETRKKYTLYVDMINADGTYSEICANRIYSGSVASKNVKFNLKKTK